MERTRTQDGSRRQAALLRLSTAIAEARSIEAGKMELSLAPFDLRGVLDEVAATVPPAGAGAA